jgi:hypothetical protein
MGPLGALTVQYDRRHFLAAGAAGLATLFVPDVSLACAHRRRGPVLLGTRFAPISRVASPLTSPQSLAALSPASPPVPFDMHLACPAGFAWSPTTPTIPDAGAITQVNNHNITIQGTGIWNFVSTGQGFWVQISDQATNSTVVWQPTGGGSVVQDPSGGPDSWTFPAAETGSSPGSSLITITIAMNQAMTRCRVSFNNFNVTYA